MKLGEALISGVKIMGNLTKEGQISCSEVDWVSIGPKLVVFNLVKSFNVSHRKIC